MVRGIVAAGDPRTAAAGAAAFASGGNAADAAVAAGFAAVVAEICVVNIGAGGFALCVEPNGRDAKANLTATSYDFFVEVPSIQKTATHDFREILVDFGSDRQPFFIGRASSAVPGLVAGLCRLAWERGRLPLSTLLRPAIKLAKEGYELSAELATVLHLLTPIFRDTAPLAGIFTPRGRPLLAGHVIVLPQLAHTLERLACLGADYFYKGNLARAIVEDHRQNGGLIHMADLQKYRVIGRAPISIGYRGYEVLLPGPPSHGGVLIAFSLKLLETVSLKGLRPGGFGHLRALAAVMMLTSKAREVWDVSSQAEVESAVQSLLSVELMKPYLEELRAILNGKHPGTTHESSVGPGHTTHISSLDMEGMAVSMTLTAGESAGYLVGETGVSLNNMLGEHDLNPHGFHVDPPGTRLRSMVSPSVVLRNGKPVLVVGSAGSNRLRSAILQTMSHVLDFSMDLDSAVNHPRIHFEAGRLQVEAGFERGMATRLAQAGFEVNSWNEKSLYFGGTQAVSRVGGSLLGGADRRRGGSVKAGSA